MGHRNFRPNHQIHKAKKTHDPIRKKTQAMYATTAWQNYRTRFLQINSECYACGAKATVVDHLRPHKGDENLFKQTDNHIPLCESHHNTVTALFDKRGMPIEKKIAWLNQHRHNGTTDWTPKRVKVLPRYED